MDKPWATTNTKAVFGKKIPPIIGAITNQFSMSMG